MKKLLIIGLMLFAGLAATGCGEEEKQESKGLEDLRVALALTGTINDGGWNQRSYEGLVAIAAKYDAETAYNENTQAAQYLQIIRTYAKDGYNVIIANGSQFTDAVKEVAAEYPDTFFLITSSDRTTKLGNGSNVAGVIADGVEQGFLQGVASAYIAQEIGAKKIGGIGGIEIPAFKTIIEGFVIGANYADKSIETVTAFTGSLDDANKMKEQSITFIQQGADIILSYANASSRGGFEATKDLGKISVVAKLGNATFAQYKNNVACSANASLAFALLDVVGYIYEGTFEGDNYIFGIADDVITMVYNADMAVAKKIQPKMEKVIEDVKSGKLDIDKLYSESKK